MDIYCDSDDCAEYQPRHGIRFTEDFHGTNRASVNRQARKDGWIVGKRDLCPDCAMPLKERNAKRSAKAKTKRDQKATAYAENLRGWLQAIERCGEEAE